MNALSLQSPDSNEFLQLHHTTRRHRLALIICAEDVFHDEVVCASQARLWFIPPLVIERAGYALTKPWFRRPNWSQQSTQVASRFAKSYLPGTVMQVEYIRRCKFHDCNAEPMYIHGVQLRISGFACPAVVALPADYEAEPISAERVKAFLDEQLLMCVTSSR